MADKKDDTVIQIYNPISKPIIERSTEIVSGDKVFYNTVQEFNRDLSIIVINAYFKRLVKERQLDILKNKKNQKENISIDSSDAAEKTYVAGTKYDDGLKILEALSATGLRSIRYAKEIAGVRQIIANDISEHAVQTIKENIKHNQVEHLIEPSHANAMTLMYLTKPNERFNCIDLDPYGCPNRFLDGAIQSIKNGGLLLVTATDMAVLAGNAPEACYVKYGSVPLRMKSCHENALRILLHSIETHANRYGKYIKPLLSISADFYIRIFVRVFTSQAMCKFSMSKQSMIYQCRGCDTFTLHPLGIIKRNPKMPNSDQVKHAVPSGPPVDTNCKHCGDTHQEGGPIWSGPIHDKTFVQELLESIEVEPLSQLGTIKRLKGVLTVVQEELDDVPLYYTLDKLCCVLKLEIIPTIKFRSALLNAGYKVSFSHACKNSIKTNAPASVLWDILRCWNKIHPVNVERLKDGTATQAILRVPPSKEYDFDTIHPDANPKSRKDSLTRFQPNPTPHWGPGTKNTIMAQEDKVAKSVRNQNKKQKREAEKSTNSDENNEEEKSKQAKID